MAVGNINRLPFIRQEPRRSHHGGSSIFAMSISAASTRLTTLISPWTGHRYVTTPSLSRVGSGSIVLMFKAREHIGHEDGPMAVFTQKERNVSPMCVRYDVSSMSMAQPWRADQ